MFSHTGICQKNKQERMEMLLIAMKNLSQYILR